MFKKTIPQALTGTGLLFAVAAELPAESALFALRGYSEPQLVRHDDGVLHSLPVDLMLPNRVRVIQNTLMIVDSGSDELILLDLAQALAWQQAGDPLAEARFATSAVSGANAWDVIALDTDRVCVSNLVAGTLAVLGPAGLLQEVPLSAATPQGMWMQEDRLLVCDSGFGSGTRLAVVEWPSLSVSFVPTLENPQALWQTGSRLDVLCTGNWSDGVGQVHGLDAGSLAPLDTLQLGSHPGSLAGDGERFVYSGDPWGSQAGVYRWDAVDRVVTHSSSGPFAPGGGTNVFHEGGLYTSSGSNVLRLDAEGATLQTIPLEDSVIHFCFAAPSAGPDLEIASSGAVLELAWQGSPGDGFELQRRPALDAGDWMTFDWSTELSYTLPLENGRAFFRVIRHADPFFGAAE